MQYYKNNSHSYEAELYKIHQLVETTYVAFKKMSRNSSQKHMSNNRRKSLQSSSSPFGAKNDNHCILRIIAPWRDLTNDFRLENTQQRHFCG